MAEVEFVGKRPDYKGDGVAVWVKQDKNNKTYLSIKLLGSVNLAAFKNEPKPEVKAVEPVKEVTMADITP